jgi:hypothetical protein
LEPLSVQVSLDPPAAIRIVWQGTGEYLTLFTVYRREEGSNDWQEVGRVEVDGASSSSSGTATTLGQTYSLIDSKVLPGTYVYGVVATNAYPFSSDIGESESIKVP